MRTYPHGWRLIAKPEKSAWPRFRTGEAAPERERQAEVA